MTKTIITAKAALTIEQNGQTLHIAKGDAFTLYGRIFSCNGVIVDLTKYAYAFEITVERASFKIPTYKFLQNYTAKNSKGEPVTFEKDQTFNTIADVVYIHDCVLDLAKLSNIIACIGDVEPTPVAPALLMYLNGSASDINVITGQTVGVTVNQEYLDYIAEYAADTVIKVNNTPVTEWPVNIVAIDGQQTVVVDAIDNEAVVASKSLKYTGTSLQLGTIEGDVFTERIALTVNQNEQAQLHFNTAWIMAESTGAVNANDMHLLIDSIETPAALNAMDGIITIDTTVAGTYVYTVNYVVNGITVTSATCTVTVNEII